MSSNPAITPDLAGFINSRKVLFDNFGIFMAFLIPIEPAYDQAVDGIPLDLFGKPLDPWATPASGAIENTAFTSAFASATLVTRPYGGRGQVRDQQGEYAPGIVAEQQLGLNIMPEDYAAFGPEASGGTATHVLFWNERFEIRQWRADGIGSLQRYVVYISQESGP